MFRLFPYVAVFIGCSQALFAQTPNNDMARAEWIYLDQPVSSETHGNTVEYNCINPELTGKCIKYHNDQWYTFTADSSSSLFININNQDCRDLRGVQLVIFTGELCEPSSYTILDCISLATQDDIYVELDQLQSGQNYWINVDGYLHDFCTYNLEVSHKPKGVSMKPVGAIGNASYSANKNTITVRWELPDSLAHLASETRILKRTANSFKHEFLAAVPFQINAYGVMQTKYQYIDTVAEPGQYHYQFVLPLNDDASMLMDELSWEIGASAFKVATLQLDYEYGEELEVSIFDVDSGTLLDRSIIQYNERDHGAYKLYLTAYIDKYQSLEITVNNLKESTITYFYVDLLTLRVVKG